MTKRRTTLKQELAKKLFPNSISDRAAMQQLRREIKASEKLKGRLAEAGPTKRFYFNRQQVKLILEHLDITIEEYEEL